MSIKQWWIAFWALFLFLVISTFIGGCYGFFVFWFILGVIITLVDFLLNYIPDWKSYGSYERKVFVLSRFVVACLGPFSFIAFWPDP